MHFKLNYSCLKEAMDYLHKNTGGGHVNFTISPNNNSMEIKFIDKLDVTCIITVWRDDNNGQAVAFPTVTKTGRLGDPL